MVGFLPAGWRGSKRRLVLLVTRMVLVTVVLFWFAGLVTGPIPKSIFPQASAVGSLRTTATDLATFLIELAEPQYLGDDIAEQIRTSQVRVDPDFSWGLGPGIQHSEYGDALWQNGNTPGFRSVMVIYPTQRIGVVVLTNSDRGQAAAYDIAQRALGGKSRWGSVFP
jgi:CubicO group peptidase (beta-lactamase class C family)